MAVRRSGLAVDVACGDDPRGDINLDVRPTAAVDVQADARQLPVRDRIAAEVYAIDVIEHLAWTDTQPFLEELYRILEPQGALWLRTPDFSWIADHYEDVPTWRLQRKLYGGQTAPTDDEEDYAENTHRCIFTPAILDVELSKAGYTDIQVSTDLPEPNHWNMGARAIKPATPK